jgi:hypothetical protein
MPAPLTELGAMDFNIARTMERIKGIVPPSSEPRPAPAAKKR